MSDDSCSADASVQKKQAFDSDVMDNSCGTVNLAKRKKPSVPAEMSDNSRGTKNSVDPEMSNNFCSTVDSVKKRRKSHESKKLDIASPSDGDTVAGQEEKIKEKRDCNIPDAFRDDIVNGTGIDNVESYLQARNRKPSTFDNCFVYDYFGFMQNRPYWAVEKQERFHELAKNMEKRYENVLLPSWEDLQKQGKIDAPWRIPWQWIDKRHHFILYHYHFLNVFKHLYPEMFRKLLQNNAREIR